jgi:hypothetical protein
MPAIGPTGSAMTETSPPEPPTGEDDQAIAADSGATSAGTGTGRGDDLGTPSEDADEEPPSEPQERDEVVSGGGVADTSDEDAETT